MIKYVKVWKQALSVILSLKPVPRNSGVRNLLLLFQYMYNVNSRIPESRRVPESEFGLLIDKYFLYEDLRLWHSQMKHKSAHAEPLILCNFPIVMDLQSKKAVFDMYAADTMREAMEFGCDSLLPRKPLCELHLSRTSSVDDTFKQLEAVDHSNYKKPLAVYFDGKNKFDLIQNKDLFHKVFHEMVSDDSGMFMFNDSKDLAWFPSRKLVGVKPSLEDMMEFSPSFGKILKEILEDYEDDEIESLYLDFDIVWDGTKVVLDLEYPAKPLTGQNKKEYVDGYVNHAFNTSVESVFLEFERGFFQVCEPHLVKLFRPQELYDVLVGKDFYDWEKLKQNTSYEGEYHVDHPTVQMFWEVFDELTEEQKTTFLWFLTGFERVPILGLENIKMTIRVQQGMELPADQYYPETHTCFLWLDLPLYSTKEVMQTRLTEALSNNRRI
ncbi:hypothetical protein INR49_031534 [Caranx melampygus]|nr:hypothetical protein INR49_031534 [Caranx melampygus]